MPSKTVSFRVNESLLAELDALTRRSGSDRTTVLVELVRMGLDAKRGRAEDPTASALSELSAEVRKLRARLRRSSQAGELAGTLEKVAERLGDVVTEQQVAATAAIKQEIATLRQHVRRSFGNYLRLACKLSEEEAREHVRKTFDT